MRIDVVFAYGRSTFGDDFARPRSSCVVVYGHNVTRLSENFKPSPNRIAIWNYVISINIAMSTKDRLCFDYRQISNTDVLVAHTSFFSFIILTIACCWMLFQLILQVTHR